MTLRVEETVCAEDLDYYLHKVDHCFKECRVQQITYGRLAMHGCKTCKFAMAPEGYSALWCTGDSWTFNKVR